MTCYRFQQAAHTLWRRFCPPTKELAENACHSQKDPEDASGLPLLHRKTSASVFACTLTRGRFLLGSSNCLQVGLCYSSTNSLMLSAVESTKQTASAAKFSGYSPSTLFESEHRGTIILFFARCVWAGGAGVGGWNAPVAEQAVSNFPSCLCWIFFLYSLFFFFVRLSMFSGDVRMCLCLTTSLKRWMSMNRRFSRIMFVCSQGDNSRLNWNPRGECIQIAFRYRHSDRF